MTRNYNRFLVRSGFTLVELLIVIAIVAIIAGLLYAGLSAAIRSSRNSILAAEIHQVGEALEQFKAKHRVYPIDHRIPEKLDAFVMQAYPRADAKGIEAFKRALENRTGAEPGQRKTINQTEALVLYLAFMSKNPRDPYRFATIMANDLLVGHSGSYDPSWKNRVPDDLDVLYQFPEGTLVDHDFDGFPEFVQKFTGGRPLIYFDARVYQSDISVNNGVALATNVLVGEPAIGEEGLAIAYASSYDSVNNRFTFYNPKSYQLICAGQDGRFGIHYTTQAPHPLNSPVLHSSFPAVAPRFPQDDEDNLTNFTDGKTFQSFLTQ
jgi:prepilin-type N-terminal cleavage/methylation domain-containing protein